MSGPQPKSTGKTKRGARKLGIKKQKLQDLETPQGRARRVRGGGGAISTSSFKFKKGIDSMS